MLTEQQLDQFHKQGYLQVRDFIDSDTVAAVQRETDELHEQMAARADEQGKTGYGMSLDNGAHIAWEERDDVRRIRQLMHSDRVCPTIDRIMRSDSMLQNVRQLIASDDIIRYHSKLLMKAAHDGSFTPWHQDWGYWQHSSKLPTQINCMLSIDAAGLENGCIRFVDGSHRQGPVDHSSFPSASFGIGLDGDIDSFEATPIESRAGDAVFFGSLVIHGSAPNASDNDRRANTFAFDRADNFLKEGTEEERL